MNNSSANTVPDYEAEQLIHRLYKFSENSTEPFVFRTNNAVAVTAARVLIKDGKIPIEDIEIWYDDMKLFIDIDGRIAEWPDGFCDVEEKFLERMLL